MFARLYQSARAIFIDTSHSEKIQATPVVEPLLDETMVTTRQRNIQDPVEDEVNEENSINVYVPNSSKRRQNRAKDEGVVVLSDDDDAEFKLPSTRKRKRLPVRAKDVESPDPVKSRLVVEIPAKNISQEPEQGNEVTTRKEVEDTKARDETQDVVAAEPLERSKHRRFGSEEAEDEFFSTAREAVIDEEDAVVKAAGSQEVEDSEVSEDDAPEAVGIEEAAKAVKLKDRDAAKAVKSQLSTSRKKRKQKDDALKKQAESSKKRKLEVDSAKTTKPTQSSAKQDTLLPRTDLNMGEGSYIVEEDRVKNGTLSSAPLSSKRSLPDILPAEYLDGTEPYNLTLFDELPRKKAKKTKFHQSREKEPKDRRIGNTTYRVTKASSTNLAPKSSSQARNTKESWLQGRSGKSISANRTPFTKGFFKK